MRAGRGLLWLYVLMFGGCGAASPAFALQSFVTNLPISPYKNYDDQAHAIAVALAILAICWLIRRR